MLNDEFVVDSGAVDEYNDQTHVVCTYSIQSLLGIETHCLLA